MNIAKAKDQIKNAMTAYFTRDELGNYRIPLEKQRPVLLIGPPGIGKTAVMEQIASELGVGLVSYSMTHHTRQSALGLPYITSKCYGGKDFQVSEYTMSEIIASVYDLMEETGIKEGILFLDEINCISETLAPCMLQFLQYKMFGQHRVPEGWIVVTAGNPPEYNKSVRDFDIVTWDRLKRIDVEPDYEVWKRYASQKGVHPSITTYLDARKKDFYKVENTVDGKQFVTARGWDDLSEMIKLYEENSIAVDEDLIIQYLQSPRTAKDFAVYYDLFNKYRSDYRIDTILAGNVSEDVLYRAQRAELDERISLLGLIFDAVISDVTKVCQTEEMLKMFTGIIKEVRNEMLENSSKNGNAVDEEHGSTPNANTDVEELKIPILLENKMDELSRKLETGYRASSMTTAKRNTLQRVIQAMQNLRAQVLKAGTSDSGEAFELIKSEIRSQVSAFEADTVRVRSELDNVFAFCEEAFPEGDEILIFVTELTVNYNSAHFIGMYGCDKYYMHNKELQFKERKQELAARAEKLSFEL